MTSAAIIAAAAAMAVPTGTFTARLTLRAGVLRFTILKASRRELRVIFGAHPWRRV